MQEEVEREEQEQENEDTGSNEPCVVGPFYIFSFHYFCVPIQQQEEKEDTEDEPCLEGNQSLMMGRGSAT